MVRDTPDGDERRSTAAPTLDPRAARDRCRERAEPSAGIAFLETLNAQERRWMEGMAGRVARAFGVDRDDLLQDLHVSLLTCGTIDRGRRTLRAWLTRRAKWQANDLRRRQSPTTSWADHSGPEPAAPEPLRVDPDWTVDRVRVWGLNRDEAQVVLLVLWGLDVSLREFAELASRSYAKTRQDKTRGLAKILALFDLDDDETAAFVACRRYPTTTAAAIHLGISNQELRARVRRAERKITRALAHTELAMTRHDEDKSHAG